jgi:mono/diheme cytochrome c family protein
MRTACLATLLLLLAAQFGSAQEKRQTVWDGAFTPAQAERGAAAFDQSCSRCHVLAAEGKLPLAGAQFWTSFSQKNVAELVDYLRSYMPNGAPGSLADAAYHDIAAAMLKANGFPSGNRELEPSRPLAEIQIVPKDGSTDLPDGALASVIGCLVKSGSGWTVARATSPERPNPTRKAAAADYGTRTLQLKFVLTSLDAMVGSRVIVSGLLIGPAGADGINVTAVNRVAEKCQ